MTARHVTALRGVRILLTRKRNFWLGSTRWDGSNDCTRSPIGTVERGCNGLKTRMAATSCQAGIAEVDQLQEIASHCPVML